MNRTTTFRLLAAFFVITFLSVSVRSLAQCYTWNYLGDRGVSAGAASETGIATAPDGTPYIIYSDVSAGGVVFVKKYVGGTWVTVGSGPVFTTGQLGNLKIAIDAAGVVYAAVITQLAKFNGTNWVSAGYSGLVADMVTGKDGGLYVYDAASVYKYNGTTWNNIAPGEYETADLETSQISLAVNASGTPFVGYNVFDAISDSYFPHVKKYVGGSWQQAGTFPHNTDNQMNLDINSAGQPCAAVHTTYGYTELAQYDPVADAWGDLYYGFNGNFTVIRFDGTGNPYFFYRDFVSGKASVYKYNGSDFVAAGNVLFSDGGITASHMAISTAGVPYVVYSDATYGQRVSVMKLFSSMPAITGSNTICLGDMTTLKHTALHGTWTSGNTAVATVDVGGLVTGVSVGTASITYVVNGCSTSMVVTVTAGAGTISGAGSVCPGTTTTLSSSITGGVWSSSNAAIAALGSASGIVSGVVAGNVTVSYTADGCTSVKALTVSSNTVPAILVLSPAPVISTIAGSSSGYAGDNGPATAAKFNQPVAVYTDRSGNTYIADYGNFRIRKIDATGTITTFAGTGVAGFSGDGGPATAAKINGAQQMAMDSYGNFYFADRYNERIRCIDPSGIITTIAGTGVAGFSGDGGAAFYAQMYEPIGIAIDADNTIYVAELLNHRIRKITTGGLISTVAGTGINGYNGDNIAATSAYLNYPAYVYIDNTGAVCFSDNGNQRYRRIDGGIITTFAGTGAATFSGDGGSATAAALRLTYGLTKDVFGNFILADNGNNRIRSINTSGIISTIAGTGVAGYSGDGAAATQAKINGATDVAIDNSGNLIIADYGNSVIRKVIGTAPVTVTGGAISMCSGDAVYLADAIAGGTWSSSNTAVATVGSTGIVTAIFTGTAVVTYAVTNACGTAVATLTVNVNSGPGTITGTSAICAGGTITLSNATTGGTWSSGASGVASVGSTGIVTGVAPGTATITYATTGSACGAATATVTVNSVPTISLTGSANGTYCGANDATITIGGLTAGATYTLQYLVGSSPVSSSIVANGSGNYAMTGLAPGSYTYITVSQAGSCMSNTLADPHVTSAVVLTEPPLTISFSASSNPLTCGAANGTITISGMRASTAYTLEYEQSGVLVSYAITSNASGNYMITGLPSGNYTYIIVANSTCTSNTIADIHVDGPIILTDPALPAITGALVACEGVTTTLSNTAPGGIWLSGSVAVATADSASGRVAAVASGTSMITYMVGLNCVAATTFSVNQTPTTLTGAATVCAGAVTTLSTTPSGGTWTSLSPTVATVNDLGGGVVAVTGIMANTVTISYVTGAGCSNSKVVTVNAQPGTITGTLSVCVGATTTLSNVLAGGSWVTDDESVATVSNGVVTGVDATTVLIYYVVGSCVAQTTVTVNALPVSGSVTGVSSLTVGASSLFTASAPGGVWSVSNTHASVSAGGTVTGASVGMDTVLYTVSNGCGNAITRSVINIIAAPPVSPITGTMTICAGYTTTLSDATPGGTWSSSVIGAASIGTNGVVTGISAGTTIITYSVSGSYVTAVVSVNASPNIITGSYVVCEGLSTTLGETTTGGTWTSTDGTGSASVGSATGIVTGTSEGTATISYTLSDGCAKTTTVTVNSTPTAIDGSLGVCVGTTSSLTDATGTGTWSSSAATKASVNAATGVVTGVAAGTATITYLLAGSCKTTATVSVNAPPATITGTKKVCPLTTTTLADGTSGGTWSSSSATVSVGSTGIITGVSEGTASISYTVGGCSATTLVTINPNPLAIAGSSSICIGSTASMSDPTPSGSAWSSSNTTVATISTSTAVATGLTAGTTTISYILSTGCYATTTLTVGSGPSAITGTLSLLQGGTTTLDDATSGGAWSSTATHAGVAAGTGNTGVVTGISAGTAIITYSTGAGCLKTAIATVNPLPNAITGYGITCVGTSTTLSDATTGGTWSAIAGTGTATVTAIGKVTGVTQGTVTIVYTLPGGGTTSAEVTVNPVPSVCTGTRVLCSGSTTTLSNTLTGGTWSSSNGAVATVGTSGIVTGTATGGTGTANITYSFGTGCKSATLVTVNILPAAISGSATACTGANTTLTDATTGGTWSSSDPTVASMGSTNIMSGNPLAGLTVGATTISYTLSTGCARALTVAVNQSPVAGSISGPTAIHIAGMPTIALSDVGGDAGGIWSSSNTAKGTVDASGNVTGIAPGTTTISYSVTGNGCTSRATQVITITASRTAPPGLPQGEEVLIALYPNPSKGTLTLSSPGTGTLTLFTLDGKEVKQYTVTEPISTIDLPSDLAAGIYMCRYIGDNGERVVVRLVYEP